MDHNLNTKIVTIQSGTSKAFSIPNGKYTDITIVFPKVFETPPVVSVTTTMSGYKFIPVIHEISPKAVTVRAFNKDTSDILNRTVKYIAIGVVAG